MELCPRAFLFVPADRQKLVASAARSTADAVILDLEDGVAQAQKPTAREALVISVQDLKAADKYVVIRVNAEPEALDADLTAALATECDAIMLPKVEGPHDLACVLTQMNATSALSLIPLIESPQGLNAIAQIAATSERISMLAFGPEDFATACRIMPGRQSLGYACQKLIFDARVADKPVIGLCGDLGNFSDIPAFVADLRFSKDIGFDGIFAIHPNQVREINRLYRPSEEEIAYLHALIDTFEQAEAAGQGSCRYDGKMIDLPIVERARLTLRQNSDQTAPA